MEQTSATTFAPASEHCVHVEGVETHPQYGPKTVLGGDTYELFSRSGENLSDELVWGDHHLSWDGDFFEAWTMDPGQEHVEALREVVENAGHDFGGVSADVVEHLLEIADGEDGWWSEKGIEVTVRYESKQSGNEMSKTGVVSGVDPQEGFFNIKREDHRVNQIRGGSIYSQSSSYPYMGEITEIVVRP